MRAAIIGRPASSPAELSSLAPIDWHSTPLARTASGGGLRVAVLGKRNHLHWDEHVAEGFVDAGCAVRHYAINRRPAAVAIGRATLRAVAGRRGAAAGDAWHARLVARDLREFAPQLVVVVSVFFVPECYLQAIHALPTPPPVLGWDGDALIRNDAVSRYSDLIDVVGTTERTLFPRVESLFPRALYLAYAANPRIYHERGISRSPRAYFCGAWTEARALQLARVAQAPITVRGPNWERLAAPSPSIQLLPGKVTMLEQARDYASHLVVWNQHQTVNNPHGSLNMRDFEATASGALLVSDHRDLMAEHFDVGEDVMTYRDDDELESLLLESVADPERSDARARRAMQRVLAHETYRHRALSILDAL